MSATRRQIILGGASLCALGACKTARAAAPKPGDPVTPRLEPSTIAVTKPSTWPSLVAAVRGVVELAGGLAFIRPGQKVLLKPAVNSSRPYPATADPEVVLAVARLVQEAGGEPFIADRTMFMRSTALTFRALGLDQAAREAKISCQPLDHAEVVSLRHPLATHWADQRIRVYRPVADADHVINLCTPRTHRLGDFTMAMKNFVGVVDGGARLAMHGPFGLKQRLAEISLVVRPSFVLMDGRKGFTDGGPDEGDLATLDFMAAGSDPLAIDAVGLGYLRMAGANRAISSGSVWSLPMMKHAAELGIGAASAAQLVLRGMDATAEAGLRARLEA
ncbi:MAG: DUF362 domain-containing protein [Archangium sp.]|nr:DUF362 domain-containing protein [Archangium sp.]